MRISDWSSRVCSSDRKPGAHPTRSPTPSGDDPGSSYVRSRRLTRLRSTAPVWMRSWARSRHKRIRILNICGRLHPLSHAARSEEHTSELQSLMRISYAVFCLKKKNKHRLACTKQYQ